MANRTALTTLHDPTETSEDTPVKRDFGPRWSRTLILLVVAIGLIVVSAKPGYRAVRTLLINRNLEGAKTAARVEDWGTARNLAHSVLLARPDDFEAFRVWHLALSHLGEPRTYLVAASLFINPRATREDRLVALKTLALQAPQAVALSAYASMSKDMQEEPAAIAALSPLLTQRGETAFVGRVLRKTSTRTTDPAIRLELLRSLCCSPTPERVAEARTIFAELIDANASEPALEGLRLLGETPGGLAPGAPLPPLPEWVNLQPKATTLHHLLALHPTIQAAPDRADAVIESAISRFLAVDPGTLGTWLIRHNKSARAAELLANRAATNPTAFIAYLHALLREKRNAEITAALSATPPGCDLVELELVKVAIARFQRDSAGETNAWNRALINAAFDQSRNRFIEVGKFASLLGNSKVVEDSWVAAVRIGWGQIPLYRDLKQVFASLASQSRSEDLLAMYAVLLRFEPQNAELLNNYYYLALLHQVAPPAAIAKALEELTAAHPKATGFLPALTMAYLMADDPAAALRQLPAMKASKLVSPLACRALEASALLLTGETEAGRAELQGVDWSVFMRCESLAFRNLLNRPKFENLPLPEIKELPPAPDIDTIPAWRKAVERLERDRQRDVLPALPAPIIPGSIRSDEEGENADSAASKPPAGSSPE